MVAKYRSALPQLGGQLLITDGGLETDLIFHRGFDLPHFAAFPLLGASDGRAALRGYYVDYLDLARSTDNGAVLESPTWRANSDWAPLLGYSLDELDAANRDAIALLQDLRREYEDGMGPIVISGCVGPRGDGYVVGTAMKTDEAERYHSRQIGVFAAAGVDMVTAITMTYANEAIGLARAAMAVDVPVAISFTVEIDGALPSGQPLADAIREVDAATGSGPAYYMINCAHPSHFAQVLEPGADWVQRIRGLRANASMASHAELDEATDLDEGDPVALGADHGRLRALLPEVTVLGGCCGTDVRHVTQIAAAWTAAA